MSQNEIIKDFESKSSTYFEDIYINKKDVNRVNRFELLDSILSEFDLNGKLVLDAGSGPAVLYELIKKHNADYTAIDLSPHNIAAAMKRNTDISAFVGSILDMPFDNETFDYVISLGCLEYIREVNDAFIEMSRVLKPGGLLIISFANVRNPGRIWNETVIKSLIKIKYYFKKKAIYSRYLHSLKEIKQLCRDNSLNIEKHIFLNFSLWGFPFSSIKILRRLDDFLSRKINCLKPISMEFIIISRKGN